MKKSLLLSLLIALSFQAFSEETNGEKEVMKSETNQKILMDKTKYFGGGAATIFVGLGTGHAIQGRYMENGWIFTAGGLMLLIAGVGAGVGAEITSKRKAIMGDFHDIVNALEEEEAYNDGISTSTYVYLGLAIVGTAIKTWEIIDIWLPPSKYKLVDQNSIKLKPLAFYSPETKFNYGLSLNYKF